MLGVLTAVHILIAIVIILIVLVQSSKGTDVGSAFGGMGSQATFGPRGTATVLSKATVGLAAAFMVTSVALTIMGKNAVGGGQSVLSGEENAPAPTAPANPASETTPAAPPSAPGAPAVNVQAGGLEGIKAHVTVEQPPGAPGSDTNQPAATVQTGNPPATPAKPAANAPSKPAPAKQPAPPAAGQNTAPSAAPSGQ